MKIAIGVPDTGPMASALARAANGMIRLFLTATLFAVAPIYQVHGQTGRTALSPAEIEVRDVHQQYVDVLLKDGTDAALERFYADDITVVGPDGELATKAQLRKRTLKIESLDDTVMRASVYGDVAVVAGESTSSGQDKGKPFKGTEGYTEVWAKRGGRWWLVAEQITPAADKLPKAAPDVTRTFGEGFTRHTATVDGMKIHYVAGGKGPPVVLLHGWPQTSHSWRKVAPAIAAKGYTVIVPDLPGLGDSGKIADTYSKRDSARHLRALVRQLGHTKIYLVGTDWGGPVAYHYAAQFPDEVRRVAIMECAFPGFGAEELTDLSKSDRIWHFHFQMVPELPEKLLAGKERIYLNYFFSGYSHVKTGIADADIEEYLRAYTAPDAMRSSLAYYRSIPQDRKDNQEAAKTKLKMPVLAVGGDRVLADHLTTNLPRLANDVRGVVLKDTGHYLAEERPQELTRELLKFFAEPARN